MKSFNLSCCAILAATTLWAANGSDIFRVSPARGERSKSYDIRITPSDTENCKDYQLDQATLKVATGADLVWTPKPDRSDPCTLAGTLDVGATAAGGPAALYIQLPKAVIDLKLKGLPKEPSISFEVIDKPAGPIPPGLAPTVDVMWKVLPKTVSADNFGARVSKLYYAIELTIGNDSGYDLQITDVGFDLNGSAKLTPNTLITSDHYRTVRSSLQHEQLIGFRNTAVNIVKALGPVLTGVTLFYNPQHLVNNMLVANHSRQNFAQFVEIFSNPFEKGLEAVFPDLTVQQLINLDNRTLREGAVIANNTQVPVIVFLSKDTIAKDRIIGQWLSNNIYSAEATHSGVPSTTPSKSRNATLDSTFKHDHNPLDVQRALGNLVLAGRSIQYLNRVRVVQSPPSSPTTPPVVVTTSPTTVDQGATGQTLVITGSALTDAAVAIDGLNVTAVKSSLNGARLEVTFDVPATADLSDHRITVKTSDPVADTSRTIRVTKPAAPPAAAAAKLDPTTPTTPANPTLTLPALSLSFTVNGTQLSQITSAEIRDSAGTKVTGTTVAVSGAGATSLKVTVTITAATPKGTYQLHLLGAGTLDLQTPFVVN
ncbi:MAG: hypothetical protein M3N54_14680 [Acidobacteriota bacterium]|nr:hypothetical protein [Acidobacteriota bacterium]